MAELWQIAIVAHERITSVYIFTNVQSLLNAIKKLFGKGFVTFGSKTKAPFFGYIAINGFHGIVTNKLIAALKGREGVHGKKEMVKLSPRALTIQSKGAGSWLLLQSFILQSGHAIAAFTAILFFYPSLK